MNLFTRLAALVRRSPGAADAERPHGQIDSRLTALLVLVESEVSDRADLLERILDQSDTIVHGAPMRLATGDCTVTGVLTRDEIVRFWTIATPFNAINEAEAGALAYLLCHRVFGISADHSANPISWNTFDLGGIPGCYLAVWSTGAFRPSSHLRCSHCSANYDAMHNSQIVTLEEVRQFFRNTGADVIRTTASANAQGSIGVEPDLVMPGRPRQESLRRVVLTLRTGAARRWRCKSCDTVHGYPGTFIRQPLDG